MRRIKQRIFCGAVCEQIVYNVGDGADVKAAKPKKPRFENEEERAAHREAISRKKNAQLINENFSQTSLYSTLTFSREDEVHTVWGANGSGIISAAGCCGDIRRRRSIWSTERGSTRGGFTCI